MSRLRRRRDALASVVRLHEVQTTMAQHSVLARLNELGTAQRRHEASQERLTEVLDDWERILAAGVFDPGFARTLATAADRQTATIVADWAAAEACSDELASARARHSRVEAASTCASELLHAAQRDVLRERDDRDMAWRDDQNTWKALAG